MHKYARIGARCVDSSLKERLGEMAVDWWTKERPQQEQESVDPSESLTECWKVEEDLVN